MTDLIDDYPRFDDPLFYQKIYYKEEFFNNRYTEKWWEQWVNMNESFRHLPHQQLVYTLYGPHTPYSNGFLFHGCGSGKSDCATQITEGNKLFLDEHSTMSLLLVPNEMIMSSIVYELLGKEVMPDGTISFTKKGTGDKYIDANLRRRLNDINNHQHTKECPDDCDKKQQAKIRKIVKYIKHEKILQYYDIETHQRFAKYIEKMSPKEIDETLSNRVIIVDEIHKIRNQTTLYKALHRAVTYTYNTKFFFLSGTACVDREYEIQPIINLLRENDGHTNLLCEKDIRLLFHKDPSVRHASEKQFASLIKGYVSFIRGMNPITFPMRIEMGTRFFADVNFNTIDCLMKGKQLTRYLSSFFDEFNPNVEANVTNELWEKTRCASRCAFEGTTDRDWLFENVWNISCKFSKMWEMFKLSDGQGAILIYAFNVEKGINLVEKFLKCNGIEPFTLENATQKIPKFVNFSNMTSSEVRQRALDICKSHENYKGDYIKFILGTGKIRTGITFRHLAQVHVVETDWNIPTTEQTIFRGARQFSHHHPDIIDTNKKILTFRYRSIVSPEQIEQLPEKVKNKFNTIIKRYTPQLKKRGFMCTVQYVSHSHSPSPDGELERSTKTRKVETQERLISIDDFMYRACLSKDIPGNRVERLLKVYAMDNPLQIRANYFPDIEDASFEGSRIANYDSLEYDCPLPNEHNLTKISKIKEPSKQELDYTTSGLIDWVLLVNDTNNAIQYVPPEVFDSIIEMFDSRTAWKFFEFKAIFKIKFDWVHTSDRIIAYVLNWIVDTQYKFTVTINNRKTDGYVIYANNVYVWTALNRIVQTSICDLIDITQIEEDDSIPNNFETRYFSIHPHLEYDNAFKDVFGDVTILKDFKTLLIPDIINTDLYSFNSSLSITLNNKDEWCGVIDNTKDNPNKFNLKLWKGSKKIAASSKKLNELKKICVHLNIDAKKINKKNNVCTVLQSKMIDMNMMLPWPPKNIPSLYRIYMVAQVWKINKVIDMIQKIVKDIVDNHGYLFINVVLKIITLRRKNVLRDVPNIKATIEDYFSQHATSPEYVLCLLERMHGARPTRVNDTEWAIIMEYYDQYFHQIYKDDISLIYKEMVQSVKTRCAKHDSLEPTQKKLKTRQ